jgi:hypothetical protein
MSQEAQAPMQAKQQATAPPKPTALSVGQMLHLMQLEMERAQEHGFPISCLMIGLDQEGDEDARAYRRERLTEVFRLLKVVTFRKKIRGLGLTERRVVLALFPHAKPHQAAEIADELIGSFHDLGLHAVNAEGLEQSRTSTISIGIGHNSHMGPMSFQILIEEAEAGLSFAKANGGDHCVQLRDVESELDRLREELEATIDEFKAHSEHQTREQADVEEDWGRDLIGKIVQAFNDQPEQSATVVRVERAVIDLVKNEVGRWQEISASRHVSEAQGQIELLERRIEKLTEHLDKTEAELRRVAAMKAIDSGIASVYDTVQGLSSGDSEFERKNEMLKGIFEANFALQKGAA